MSDSDHSTGAGLLVTAEDIAGPMCRCGHTRQEHSHAGCYGRAQNLLCQCRMSTADVDAVHIERIVRREIATELERIVRDEGNNSRYELIAAATLLDRAEEIRNG